jgi:hypothetical protein
MLAPNLTFGIGSNQATVQPPVVGANYVPNGDSHPPAANDRTDRAKPTLTVTMRHHECTRFNEFPSVNQTSCDW